MLCEIEKNILKKGIHVFKNYFLSNFTNFQIN